MFDHVEFSVKNYEKSFAFYNACLPCLGFKLLFHSKEHKDFGFGVSDKATEFLLTESGESQPQMHFAFKANSEAAVQEFYSAAISSGAKCNGEPGYRKDYGPGYYAAFVIDPDGHNIEAVFRDK